MRSDSCQQLDMEGLGEVTNRLTCKVHQAASEALEKEESSVRRSGHNDCNEHKSKTSSDLFCFEKNLLSALQCQTYHGNDLDG